MEVGKLNGNLVAGWFCVMAAAGLSLGGCQRLEPAPESLVLMQSTGTFSLVSGSNQDAILLIYNRGTSPNLTFEIKDRTTQRSLVMGAFPGVLTYRQLFADARGELRSQLSGATIRVAQPASLSKNLARIMGSGSNGATGGNFQFEGGRWIQYNSGLLERGMEGRIHLTLQGADGSVRGEYEGMVTRQMRTVSRSRVFSGGPLAVGTSATGTAGAGHCLYWLDRQLWCDAVPATIALALPYGAGKIEVGGERRIFDFNPQTDVTYPHGRGEIRMVSETVRYVEVSDLFQGHITVPHVDFGDGVTGTGSGDFDYRLSIAISPERVVTHASVSLTANLHTSDNKRLDFNTDRQANGQPLEVQTELDW